MLIIYSHPNHSGHCGYILDKIKNNLESKKITFEILDLYALDYDPRLKADEHYTSGNKKISPQNQSFQEKIKLHKKLIFIYPTWWGGPPAILKGWLDRVFTPGFGYYYKNGLPKKLLKDVSAIVITTSGGPKILKVVGINFWNLKSVTKDALNFCGIKTKGYIIDKATQFNTKQKNKIDRLVNKLDF